VGKADRLTSRNAEDGANTDLLEAAEEELADGDLGHVDSMAPPKAL
jgi:hypothetical protein